MHEEQRRPPAVFPDTNLFVAALRGRGRVTDSQRLLVQLIEEPELQLVGDALLAVEMAKYARAFGSPVAQRLQTGLLARLELIEPRERHIRACEPFFPARAAADLLHAATCLESGATLVSDDHDFDAVVAAGVINRLTITQAVRTFL